MTTPTPPTDRIRFASACATRKNPPKRLSDEDLAERLAREMAEQAQD